MASSLFLNHDWLLAKIIETLSDAKAEDVISLDLLGRAAFTDAMVIASGSSSRHVHSIADRLATFLKTAGYGAVRPEGLPACEWVLIDAGSVIVHVFQPEKRAFYNLEKLWGPNRPQDYPDHFQENAAAAP